MLYDKYNIEKSIILFYMSLHDGITFRNITNNFYRENKYLLPIFKTCFLLELCKHFFKDIENNLI